MEDLDVIEKHVAKNPTADDLVVVRLLVTSKYGEPVERRYEAKMPSAKYEAFHTSLDAALEVFTGFNR